MYSDLSLPVVASVPSTSDVLKDCSQRPHRRVENVKEQSSRPPGGTIRREDDGPRLDAAGPRREATPCQHRYSHDPAPHSVCTSPLVHSSWYQELPSDTDESEYDEDLYYQIADDYTDLCREVQAMASTGYAMPSRSPCSNQPSPGMGATSSDHSHFGDSSLYYFFSHEPDGGAAFQ